MKASNLFSSLFEETTVTISSSSASTHPTCINYGCNKLVASSGKRLRPVCGHCHNAGYKTGIYAPGVTPFRQGRCSNTDGHLDFPCYIDWDRVDQDGGRIKTHIDHKDGNHLNNTLENCEELCEACHSEKGRRAGDYKGHRY